MLRCLSARSPSAGFMSVSIEPGMDDVDRDAARPQIARHAHGEADQGGLAHRITLSPGMPARSARHEPIEMMRPPSPISRLPPATRRTARAHIDGDDLRSISSQRDFDRPADRDAGIVDQDVEPPEFACAAPPRPRPRPRRRCRPGMAMARRCSRFISATTSFALSGEASHR